MEENNIVNQSYWDESYKDITFSIPNTILTKEIRQIFTELKITDDEQQEKSCFEIGCYPGGHLAFFGKYFGYEANGVDLTKELDDKLENWLIKNGIKVGNIYQDDYENCINTMSKSKIKFDFVYSLGFIEHFINYKSTILMHDKILKPGGLLLIATPNFRGLFQKNLHKYLDRQNFDRHIIESMNPDKWEDIIKPLGFSTLYKGYVGGFNFWVDNQERNYIQRILTNLFLIISDLSADKKIPNSGIYSPYCILLARKNEKKETNI